MATYRIRVEGKEYEVTVTDSAGGGAHVVVEGRSFEVEPAAMAHAAAGGTDTTVAPTRPAPVASPAGAGSGQILAPIPGVVTKILVMVGDVVEAGQVVLKLEAMKMENDINAPLAGTVKQVAISEGAEVRDGQLLVSIG
jgi:biotin carboxyl carrier protein